MKKKSGFTLIELMIVVIIVGILAAVGIPMMSANTDKAKSTEAQTMVGACQTAGKLYVTEHGTAAAPTKAGLVTAGLLDANDFADNKYFQFSDLNVTFSTSGKVTAADVTGSGIKVSYDGTSFTTAKVTP